MLFRTISKTFIINAENYHFNDNYILSIYIHMRAYACTHTHTRIENIIQTIKRRQIENPQMH